MFVADLISRIYTKKEEDKKRVNLSRCNKQIELKEKNTQRKSTEKNIRYSIVAEKTRFHQKKKEKN
jgi:hypothetical protein